jgi:hypothetical protein
MVADLDLPLIAVYCIADDFPPEREENARGKLTDAEVIRMCIAQAIMGISSDERFLAVARRRLAASVPAASRAHRVSQAAAAALWQDRGADRALRATERWLPRRSAVGRLHPGGVRTLPRDGQARRRLQPH